MVNVNRRLTDISAYWCWMRGTRLLGQRTGLRIPTWGFGGAGIMFGGRLKPAPGTQDIGFKHLSDDEAGDVLEAAWTCGIRYYDTSPWYGRGQAEHRMGRFLYDAPREEFVLSTKVGRVLHRPHKVCGAAAAAAGPHFSSLAGWETGHMQGGLQFDHTFDYSYDG